MVNFYRIVSDSIGYFLTASDIFSSNKIFLCFSAIFYLNSSPLSNFDQFLMKVIYVNIEVLSEHPAAHFRTIDHNRKS